MTTIGGSAAATGTTATPTRQQAVSSTPAAANAAITASNNTNNNITDSDSVLDISEQTLRPVDNAINQQRIDAWHPILDPVFVIIILFYLGVILIPTGYKIDSIQKNTVEMIQTYDAYSTEYNVNETICGIDEEYNANRLCNVTFTTDQFMEPPILIHYEITNFHQNHRAYYKSRDPFQLAGNVGSQASIDAEACEPINKLGNITINPCGLIANTFFNDQFVLVDGNDINGVPLIMREDGIAWQSDVQYAFSQPNGFDSDVCANNTCDESCCLPDDTCKDGLPYQDPKTGKCYRYRYPLDDTTQYLYETYPNVISPIEGVTNEHFIVWMRIATQPNFRKLYGWIDQPIAPNTTLTFQISSNYVVTRFKGSKSLVISTTSIFGGRNPYLAPIFIYVGIFCFAAGIFFTLKHTIRPRKLADPNYLSYKEE